MRRIGIDTGGTFTDLLLLEDGVLQAVKVPSTPADPSAAVVEGLAHLGQAGEIIHGSTVEMARPAATAASTALPP